jgi:hypothetical protein
MPYKNIMRLVPAMKATALAKESSKLAVKKKPISVKDVVKGATTTIVGTSLLKVEAGLIEGL